MQLSFCALFGAFFGKHTKYNSNTNPEDSSICSQGIEKRVSPRGGYLRQLPAGGRDAMVVEQNNRANAVNDKHVASDIATKRWQSSTMEYVPFTQNDRALVMKPLHYYVPVNPQEKSGYSKHTLLDEENSIHISLPIALYEPEVSPKQPPSSTVWVIRYFSSLVSIFLHYPVNYIRRFIICIYMTRSQ